MSIELQEVSYIFAVGVSVITIMTTLVGIGVMIGQYKSFKTEIQNKFNELEKNNVNNRKLITMEIVQLESRVVKLEEHQSDSKIQLNNINTTLTLFIKNSEENWNRMFKTLDQHSEVHKSLNNKVMQLQIETNNKQEKL